MSILQGHVIFRPLEPSCLVATLPGTYSLNLKYGQINETPQDFGSCSMDCLGKTVVVTYSRYNSLIDNKVLTFENVENQWTLVDTKLFNPTNYYFPGVTGYGNNNYLKITGDGKKLFMVLGYEGSPDASHKIVSYDRSGAGWVNEQTISRPEGVYQLGGISVSYDGEVLACVGVSEDVNVTEPGKLVLMIRENNEWVLVDELSTCNFYSGSTFFGPSVSSDGSTVAFPTSTSGGFFGSNNIDNPVKIYTKVANVWTETGSVSTPDSGIAEFSFFGQGMSLNATGDVLAIGAPLYSVSYDQIEEGRAFIAQIVDGVWTITATIPYPGTPSTSGWRGWFGVAMALTSSGGRLAVSSEYGGKLSTDPASYIYDEVDGVWTLSENLSIPANEFRRESSIAMAGDGSATAFVYLNYLPGDYGASYVAFYNLTGS